MDYKYLFRQQALQDFQLNAEDYFEPFNVEQFISNINSLCLNSNEYYAPKTAIKKLIKLYELYSFICDDPSSLTEQEQLDMQQMKNYLNKNRGHLYGYFAYRKQFYEEEIGRYYELSLTNKMYILANKDFILQTILQKIQDIQDFENHKIKIKPIITPKTKQDKRNWANQKTLCVCGKTYNKSGKALHCKGKHHIQFIQENTHSNQVLLNSSGENIQINFSM